MSPALTAACILQGSFSGTSSSSICRSASRPSMVSILYHTSGQTPLSMIEGSYAALLRRLYLPRLATLYILTETLQAMPCLNVQNDLCGWLAGKNKTLCRHNGGVCHAQSACSWSGLWPLLWHLESLHWLPHRSPGRSQDCWYSCLFFFHHKSVRSQSTSCSM